MSRKALRVQIQLDLQAVTCPGVWLCPNGKVSLQMYMLDSCIQTTALPPVFPLLYHEQFIFYKTFYSAHTLIDLQSYIDKDFLYAELVQWQNEDLGNVIASFQTSLQEVLYPSSSDKTLSGLDIDLLMEPSKNFPGIISPKIEISTRTTVEEIICDSTHRKSDSYVINPKTIPSNYISTNMKRNLKPPRQKRVCHSLEYYKTKPCFSPRKTSELRPPFIYKKADDSLLARKPQSVEDCCSKKCRACLEGKKIELCPVSKSNSSKLLQTYSYEMGKTAFKVDKYTEPCACESSHSGDGCQLCTKYSSYFDSGRTPQTNVNYCTVKTGNAFVCKVNKPNPVKEQPSKKSCACSINSNKTHPTTPVNYDSNESQRCCLNPTKESPCNNRLCIHCSQPPRPSLAKQIHRRIKETLRCSDNNEERSSGSRPASGSPRFRNCDHGYYKTLGKFYKDLYRC